MKFGIRYCNTGPYVEPARAVELVDGKFVEVPR